MSLEEYFQLEKGMIRLECHIYYPNEDYSSCFSLTPLFLSNLIKIKHFRRVNFSSPSLFPLLQLALSQSQSLSYSGKINFELKDAFNQKQGNCRDSPLRVTRRMGASQKIHTDYFNCLPPKRLACCIFLVRRISISFSNTCKSHPLLQLMLEVLPKYTITKSIKTQSLFYYFF